MFCVAIFASEFPSLNGKLENIYEIKSATYDELGIDTSSGFAAGASGYGHVSLSLGNIKRTIDVRIHTPQIGALQGFQITIVFLDAKNLYFTYYAPNAVTADNFESVKWIITYQ